MKYKNLTDSEILSVLISQVQKAANGQPETKVRTFITIPLWKRFLKAANTEYGLPTDWNMNHDKCRRVFGSDTRLVKGLHSRDFRSWSFIPR